MLYYVHFLKESFVQLNYLKIVAFDIKNCTEDYEETYEYNRIYQLDHVELYDFGEFESYY